MLILANTLYFLLVSVYFITALFVVFHLHRYMIDHAFSRIVIVLFSVVTMTLLFMNLLLFFSLPLEEILGDFEIGIFRTY